MSFLSVIPYQLSFPKVRHKVLIAADMWGREEEIRGWMEDGVKRVTEG